MKVTVFNHNFNVYITVLNKGRKGLCVISEEPSLMGETVIPFDKFVCDVDETTIRLLTAKGIGNILTWRKTNRYAANYTLKVMALMGIKTKFADLVNKNIKTIEAEGSTIINTSWTGGKALRNLEQLDQVIQDILLRSRYKHEEKVYHAA